MLDGKFNDFPVKPKVLFKSAEIRFLEVLCVLFVRKGRRIKKNEVYQENKFPDVTVFLSKLYIMLSFDIESPLTLLKKNNSETRESAKSHFNAYLS